MPSLPTDTFSSLHSYVRSLPKHFDDLSEFLLTLNRSSSSCYCCFDPNNWPAMLSQSLCSKRKNLDYFQFTDQNRNHRLLWFFSSWASIHGLWAFFFGFHGECWMWKNSLYYINLADASTREGNPNGLLRFTAILFCSRGGEVQMHFYRFARKCPILTAENLSVSSNYAGLSLAQAQRLLNGRLNSVLAKREKRERSLRA